MKPIIMPDIFFTKFEIFFGFSIIFSLIKIKNNPTINANIEKNKTKAGVFKFTAKNVPAMTPKRIKIPNDFTILKSTALYSIWVLVDIIDVGIIIAKDVPTDKCILVTISKSKTVKA